MIICAGLQPAENRERNKFIGFIVNERVEMNLWCCDGFQAEQISDDRCTPGDRRQKRRRIETDIYQVVGWYKILLVRGIISSPSL